MKVKITRTRMIKKVEEHDVPDYFHFDNTPIGKVVDYLLEHGDDADVSYVRYGVLADTDPDRFDRCRELLGSNYSLAGSICELLGLNNNGRVKRDEETIKTLSMIATGEIKDGWATPEVQWSMCRDLARAELRRLGVNIKPKDRPVQL